MIRLRFLPLVVLALVACKSKDEIYTKQSHAYEEYSLKGKVKRVEHVTYLNDGNGGDVCKGKVVEKKSLNGSGTFRYVEFDKHGNVIRKTSIEKGAKDDVYENIYGDRNCLLSIVHEGDTTNFAHIFDGEAKIEVVQYLNTSLLVTARNKYDYNGNLIEVVTYAYNYESLELLNTLEVYYAYNRNNQLIRHSFYSGEKNTKFLHQHFEYDNNGKKKETVTTFKDLEKNTHEKKKSICTYTEEKSQCMEIMYDNNGNEIERYVFTYDSIGNWTECQYDFDTLTMSPKYILSQKIEYYK